MEKCKDLIKILVVGDIMLDTYHYGKVTRISPEAPVPVLCEKKDGVRYVPGGAANVAVNLVAAGVEKVDMFSVVGEDSNGEVLLKELADRNIGTDLILKDETRPTTNKLRYIGQNNQQILRVDEESKADVVAEALQLKREELQEKIQEYDLIVLSDYLKGFLTVDTTKWVIRSAEENHIPVLVDVKDTNYSKYQGATLLKPNQNELQIMSGMETDTEEKAATAAIYLCEQAKSRYVLATLGANGMILTDSEKVLLKVRSTAKEVYDVTGAGDTVIAYLASELASGREIEEAVRIANYAAGIQVSKMGTSAVYPEEVKEAMNASVSQNKQLNFYRPDGMKSLEGERQKGKKIVFTNGCFDILHAGHVDYLRKARKLGDCLVVGVNSDSSVRRLKGNTRPINNIADRMVLLSALEFVDYVVPFEEDTPAELIKAVLPDVLVKGGDYNLKDIVGADTVIERGGYVTTIPFVEGKSTTRIINKIVN